MDPGSTGSSTPTLPAMRALLYLASVLVLIIGLSLFFLSDNTAEFFAWTIGVPLQAAFLGASYLTAFVLEFLAARERVWARARIAVPAVLIFTSLTLVVTLLHLDRFHFNAPLWYTVVGTWVWFLVYASVPILMAITLFFQLRARRGDPARVMPLQPWVRLVLFAQGAVMLVLGIGFFLVPETFNPLWVWALTPLTGRALGAWLIGLGIAAVHAGVENDWARLRAIMAGYVVFAVLQGVALMRYPTADGLNWSAPNTWIYVAFLLSFLFVGVFGVLQVRAARRSPTA
jgi:predicted outer membrane lipoprotein